MSISVKKIVATLLVAVMLCSLLPLSALSVAAEGNYEANELFTAVQTGVRDTVFDDNGLAFRFTLKAVGAETESNNRYVSSSASILPDNSGKAYPLIRAGAVVTNNAAVGKSDMTLEDVNGKKVINVTAQFLCDVSEDTLSFAVRIINIPEKGVGRNIYARPYYVYANEKGEEIVIYGKTKGENYNRAADPKASIKILSIGHSFSQDVMGTYLYDMLKQAGYKEIVLGYIHVPGASLNIHWTNMSQNINNYRHYGKNVDGKWVNTNSPYAINALMDEKWDYVTMHTSPDYVGGENNEYQHVADITHWIEANSTNPNVEIKWHMIWAFSKGCDLWSYAYHGYDQMTMYNNIVNVTKKEILPNNTFTGIIPSCTAIQNARSSFIGDNFNEKDATQGGNDGYHLNTKYGDFTGSLTWACYFSGMDANEFTSRSAGMTEQEFKAIAEAVNNALKNPMELTESSFK